MRKRRTVFFDSLLAILLSWGITHIINKSDEESIALMTSALLLVCTLVLIPVSLRCLNTNKSFKGGIYFLFMLLPLVVALSHPTFPTASFFTPLWALTGGTAPLSPWLINLLVNSFIFFLTGYLIVKISNEQKVTWKITALTTFLLTSFYVLSLSDSYRFLSRLF